MNRLIRTTAFSFLAIAGASVAQAPPAPPPAPVDAATAVRAEFAPLHWAPGTVASREDARVAAEIAGRVVEVAEVGRELRRGDVLARLDDAPFRLREQQAQADLARLQAQLELVRKQEARYQALVRDAGISGAQLDQVTAERRMREQDVVAARVALEQARLARRQAVVRAPFDGVVVERAVEAGEYLGVGAPVARVVNTRALEVRTRAPVALASRLRPGGRVTLRDGGRSEDFVVGTVVPVGDGASRQLELRFALDAERAAGLAVGAAVQVGVPRDEPRAAVAVPRDALLLRPEGSYVVRIGDDGLAQRIPVETGAVQGGLVEVKGGIRAGERLVVRGAERLRPGQAVSVRTPPAAAAAAAAARSRP